MKLLFTFLISLLISNNTFSNEYFNALELFNKRKISDSVILFKQVADDEKNPKRSDAMYNLAIIYDNGLVFHQIKQELYIIMSKHQIYPIYMHSII